MHSREPSGFGGSHKFLLDLVRFNKQLCTGWDTSGWLYKKETHLLYWKELQWLNLTPFICRRRNGNPEKLKDLSKFKQHVSRLTEPGGKHQSKRNVLPPSARFFPLHHRLTCYLQNIYLLSSLSAYGNNTEV